MGERDACASPLQHHTSLSFSWKDCKLRPWRFSKALLYIIKFPFLHLFITTIYYINIWSYIYIYIKQQAILQMATHQRYIYVPFSQPAISHAWYDRDMCFIFLILWESPPYFTNPFLLLLCEILQLLILSFSL